MILGVNLVTCTLNKKKYLLCNASDCHYLKKLCLDEALTRLLRGSIYPLIWGLLRRKHLKMKFLLLKCTKICS